MNVEREEVSDGERGVEGEGVGGEGVRGGRGGSEGSGRVRWEVLSLGRHTEPACVCVCVRACVRACMRACVCACVCVQRYVNKVNTYIYTCTVDASPAPRPTAQIVYTPQHQSIHNLLVALACGPSTEYRPLPRPVAPVLSIDLHLGLWPQY